MDVFNELGPMTLKTRHVSKPVLDDANLVYLDEL